MKKFIIITCLIVGTMILNAMILVVSIQGLYASNPTFALMADNTIEGTVISHERTHGYSLVVSTKQFGELVVSCTAESYTEIEDGDAVTVSCKLVIEGNDKYE